MSLEGYEFVALLAYQGRADCTDARCRRMLERHDDGSTTFGPCMGYHCPVCHEPCSMMGHRACAAPEQTP